MERFYGKDPDKEEPFFGSNEEDDMEDFEEDEAIAFIDQNSIINVMQMDLEQTELNQKLLDKAIRIARQSWFWKFKKNSVKIKEIEEIYQRLNDLTDNHDKDKKEED